jgi:hypothetical protein
VENLETSRRLWDNGCVESVVSQFETETLPEDPSPANAVAVLA